MVSVMARHVPHCCFVDASVTHEFNRIVVVYLNVSNQSSDVG